MNYIASDNWIDHPPADPQGRVIHLLRRFAFAYVDHVSGAASELDLHPTDLRALAEILDAARGREVLTVGGLGAKLHLNQPTVTAIVDRLERRALVSRRPVDGDRRKVGLAVTDIGRQLGWTAFGPLVEELHGHLSAAKAMQLRNTEAVLDHGLNALEELQA